MNMLTDQPETTKMPAWQINWIKNSVPLDQHRLDRLLVPSWCYRFLVCPI